MFVCRRSTFIWTRTSRIAHFHARKFHFHSRSVARGLQDNAWWLLPVAVLTGGYTYYKHRHQLWTRASVSFSAADQPSGQDEFRVSVGGNNKNERMDLKRDAEEWMPQAKDIVISNTRRAVVFSLGMGGKRSRDLYMTS